MYGMSMIVAMFMLSIVCISGRQMWSKTKKRVPTKQPLHEGTLNKKQYRNYITKVMR